MSSGWTDIPGENPQIIVPDYTTPVAGVYRICTYRGAMQIGGYYNQNDLATRVDVDGNNVLLICLTPHVVLADFDDTKWATLVNFGANRVVDYSDVLDALEGAQATVTQALSDAQAAQDDINALAALAAQKADEASGSATAAGGYKNTAEAARASAQSSAITSAASAATSAEQADLSRRMANELPNVPVPGGGYSAYHWREEAAEIATKSQAVMTKFIGASAFPYQLLPTDLFYDLHCLNTANANVIFPPGLYEHPDFAGDHPMAWVRLRKSAAGNVKIVPAGSSSAPTITKLASVVVDDIITASSAATPIAVPIVVPAGTGRKLTVHTLTKHSQTVTTRNTTVSGGPGSWNKRGGDATVGIATPNSAMFTQALPDRASGTDSITVTVNLPPYTTGYAIWVAAWSGTGDTILDAETTINSNVNINYQATIDYTATGQLATAAFAFINETAVNISSSDWTLEARGSMSGAGNNAGGSDYYFGYSTSSGAGAVLKTVTRASVTGAARVKTHMVMTQGGASAATTLDSEGGFDTITVAGKVATLKINGDGVTGYLENVDA